MTSEYNSGLFINFKFGDHWFIITKLGKRICTLTRSKRMLRHFTEIYDTTFVFKLRDQSEENNKRKVRYEVGYSLERCEGQHT